VGEVGLGGDAGAVDLGEDDLLLGAVRQTVNRWILSSGEFDGTIDFDRATRDPARPNRLRANLQSGDWLHPNDEGYRVMGDAIRLGVLR
jgi:lysophospholipase L1-like esterase